MIPPLRKPMKRSLSPEELKFCRENFNTMTARELYKTVMDRRPADQRFNFTDFRICLNKNDIRHYEMQYWLPEEIDFLKHNYKKMGDTEIAELLSKRPGSTKFNKKRVWKKRQYLKLQRTKKEIYAIYQRNIDQGRYSGLELGRGYNKLKEGEITIQSCGSSGLYKFIVIKGKKVDYRRYIYEQYHGKLRPGQHVFSKDGNPLNCNIGNLTTKLKLLKKEDEPVDMNACDLEALFEPNDEVLKKKSHGLSVREIPLMAGDYED